MSAVTILFECFCSKCAGWAHLLSMYPHSPGKRFLVPPSTTASLSLSLSLSLSFSKERSRSSWGEVVKESRLKSLYFELGNLCYEVVAHQVDARLCNPRSTSNKITGKYLWRIMAWQKRQPPWIEGEMSSSIVEVFSTRTHNREHAWWGGGGGGGLGCWPWTHRVGTRETYSVEDCSDFECPQCRKERTTIQHIDDGDNRRHLQSECPMKADKKLHYLNNNGEQN